MNGVPVRERVESDIDEAMVMEVDSPLLLPGEEDQQGRGGGASVDLENPVDIEKVLSFGRDLQALFNQVTASKPNDKLKTMLQVEREREREREIVTITFSPSCFRIPLACWLTLILARVQLAISLILSRENRSAQL